MKDGENGRKHKERKREGGREVVGVGGYQGQEPLRSPTPAVPSQGSRWAISGRMLTAAAPADQQRRAAREVGGGPSTGGADAAANDDLCEP